MSLDAMMYDETKRLGGWEEVEFCIALRSTRMISSEAKTGDEYAEDV